MMATTARRTATFTAALACAAVLPARAAAQPYIEAALGRTQSDFSLGPPYNGTIDDNGISFGAAAGLQLGDHWGLQAGWDNFGDFDGRATPCPAGEVCAEVIVPTEDNDITGYTLSVLPQLPIGDYITLFGKVGYFNLDIDTKIRFPNEEFSESGLALGIGARVRFRDDLSLSVETLTLENDLSQLALGVHWRPLAWRRD